MREPDASERIVWARKDVALTTCPKSYITAQSSGWLEEFSVRARLGITDIRDLPARDVEAFLILEQQQEEEIRDAADSRRSSNRSVRRGDGRE